MLKRVGGNTGFDALGDDPIAQNLAGLLSLLEKEERLPKTILYTLNQKNNYVLATIAACFQQEGVPGRVQLGPAWWFNDNRDGILCQLKDFANAGVLATFVGMLTDSRCYISYPRHEYFRRIFCDLLGGWVEQGEFTSDPQVLKTLVEAVCYRNALRYFNAPS